jgi:oligopeptidase B
MTTQLTPPVAKIAPKTLTSHGDIRTDNYFWLRDRSDPDVLAYLEAENQYTATMMEHTEGLQTKLYQEMLGRIKETDQEVPERLDDYYYYTRTEEGKPYPIYCRKTGSLDAPEEVLLDQNELATGHTYCGLGVYEVSPDHQLLAYSVDTSGAETYTIYIKDLNTGQLLPDVIPNTYYSLEWANDNQTFFYSALDPTKRPYQVYRHILGQNPGEDSLLYEEADEAFTLWIRKTRSKAYLLVHLRQTTTTEVHYLPADEPLGQFRVIQPRQRGTEYVVEHHDERFFIVTNDEAPNFRVVTAPTSAPGKENWREFIPHRPEVRVYQVEAFQDHLVIYQREHGLEQFRVMHLPGQETHQVEFPEAAYTVTLYPNREFNTTLLRFTYASLVTPDSVFDYDMNSRTRELKKQQEVLGEYDPAAYQTERILATAADGAQIPISLVYKKSLRQENGNPTLLYGYGAYEACIDPSFSSNRLSLLDRGLVYAIAHLRGGGVKGRTWYEQGKLLHKKNTFTDFIACAEHLIAQNYTDRNRLAAWGRSAGGLLMGAITNMRPDLFTAVVAGVPFVDTVTTMLDASIPLTTSEFDEWGNPQEKIFYDYMKSYSPYDNVEVKDYPHLLVTTGLNDPRVAYWEPAKWVAKLRALKTDQNLLVLKTDMSAGHSGPSGRYEYLKEMAFIYVFILDRLGVKD